MYFITMKGFCEQSMFEHSSSFLIELLDLLVVVRCPLELIALLIIRLLRPCRIERIAR
jgi:hypothetical protein